MTTTNSDDGRTEKELALWMLERMRESSTLLDAVRAARIDGYRHPLDTPAVVDPAKIRLRALYEGDDPVDVPSSLAARIEALAERDVLASGEALIEKAMAAYLAEHVRMSPTADLAPISALDAAQDEIEGRTTGAFKAGFVAGLATAARAELVLIAERERGQERERD